MVGRPGWPGALVRTSARHTCDMWIGTRESKGWNRTLSGDYDHLLECESEKRFSRSRQDSFRDSPGEAVCTSSVKRSVLRPFALESAKRAMLSIAIILVALQQMDNRHITCDSTP